MIGDLAAMIRHPPQVSWFDPLSNPLADPLVWELLPLTDRDRALACQVSKATRNAVTQAWTRQGLSLSARTAAKMLAEPRWDCLTRLRLRDSMALPIGRLPLPSFDFLARPAAFANLWELTLRFFKFPLDFEWTPEMLPALRSLDIVGIVTPATFPDDTRRYVELFRRVVPQLRSFSIKVDNVALKPSACTIALAVPAPALQTLVNVGRVLETMTVDAPLRVLELDGRSAMSIEKMGPAAHATLERITLHEACPEILPALAPFRSLRTASLTMGRTVGFEEIERCAASLVHLPENIEDLSIDFGLGFIQDRHTLTVRWPDKPLRHLAALKTLCVRLTFPPRGLESLVRHLLGARPSDKTTIHAASALTAELESRLMFVLEDDDDYDEQMEMRAIIEDLENTPDLTPEDVEACPCKDLQLTGISVF